jgi:hypothetical protein
MVCESGVQCNKVERFPKFLPESFSLPPGSMCFPFPEIASKATAWKTAKKRALDSYHNIKV